MLYTNIPTIDLTDAEVKRAQQYRHSNSAYHFNHYDGSIVKVVEQLDDGSVVVHDGSAYVVVSEKPSLWVQYTLKDLENINEFLAREKS